MTWEPYAGPMPLTPEHMPLRVHTGASPWPVRERPTAVQISRYDVPDFDGLALCAEADPEMFHPERGNAEPAKAICRRCDVVDECLAWALTHDEQFGIWGATSGEERRKMRQRWGLNHIGTAGSNTDLNAQVSAAIRWARIADSADNVDESVKKGPGRSSNSAWPAPADPGGTAA